MMTYKFRGLVLALLLACCGLPLLAQSAVDLTGIWQMVVVDQDGDRSYLPIFKEFYADGKFTMFRQDRNGKPFRIFQTGTYELPNDSTLREHISASHTNRDIIGKSNDLGIRFAREGKFMHCSFHIPGISQKMEEIWMRVEMPAKEMDEIPGRYSNM